MPICMGYFAKTTASQNRAKLGGIIILLIGVGYPLILIIGSQETFLLTASLGVCQILGLISILSIKSVEEHLEQKERVSYRSIISNKTFLLYVAPWLMFSLINELTMDLNTNYFSTNISDSVWTKHLANRNRFGWCLRDYLRVFS